MTEVWERRRFPAGLYGRGEDNPVIAIREINYDDRGNATFTKAEVEGLLRLAWYEKRTQ